MIILGIETSCDETALSLVEATGTIENPSFNVLGSALYSQAHLHAEFGGVFPNLAKREHGKNLIPLFQKLLQDSGLEKKRTTNEKVSEDISVILNREHELIAAFERYIPTIEKPAIDLIAVTNGPGLEPALWVGISFAKALGAMWNIPVMPTNHMEGHIASVLFESVEMPSFPAIALLISGGHTELIKVNAWGTYELIGMTRDDAVGEAFDKVARMLELPYPGGPHVSKLAEEARGLQLSRSIKLPRPMISTDDYSFSFSGLKTAVLYTLRDLGEITDEMKKEICREFEDAVGDVLVTKTKKALEEFGASTLIIGGGVVANSYLRSRFELLTSENANLKLLIPHTSLSTDNAIMIAAAGYLTHLRTSDAAQADIKAVGNLRLE